MENEVKTGCVCPGEGSLFCERHQCNKSAHFHKLCQNNQNYRLMWENGRGPGQTNVQPVQKEENPSPPRPDHSCGACKRAQELQTQKDKEIASVVQQETKMPSLVQQAVNFGGALVKHAVNGFGTVTPEQQEERLAICRACPLFKDGRCLACGCVVAAKTSWKSSSCPKSYWGPIQ